MQTTPTPQQRLRRSDRYTQATVEQMAEQPMPENPFQPVTRPTAAQYQAPRRQSAPSFAPPLQTMPEVAEVPSAPLPHGTAQYAPYTPPSPPRAPQPMARPATHRMLESPPPSPAARRQAEQAEERFPVALTTGIVVLLLLCAALFTGEVMMNNYLTQQQEARKAAYQQVVTRHPIQYQDLIEHYAAEYNLQPAFVSAIILNESSFNTAAESSVGARGLMQLMPDTAGDIARKLGMGNDYDLWDAETNIRFGCYYLNYLSTLFGGDAVVVASAYHAGQGTVRNWLANSSYSPDGRTLQLDAMPDDWPTKTYAGRVTRDYAIYDALYYQVFNRADVDSQPAADNRSHR